MDKQLEIRERLFNETAKILNRTAKEVESFCDGGDWDATLLVTPEDLAEQIKEYEGAK